MDSEQLFIDENITSIIDKAKDNKNKICAVGISTIKALETAATTNGRIKPYEGWTNKFIFPPYNFSVANSLITNFHLPYSSLLMVATAFGGFDLIMNAYEVAIKENYRFGSYGDAMLIID
jgi:S-adenosylmethionine:tRNA ribosyltransferase-isomerase